VGNAVASITDRIGAMETKFTEQSKTVTEQGKRITFVERVNKLTGILTRQTDSGISAEAEFSMYDVDKDLPVFAGGKEGMAELWTKVQSLIAELGTYDQKEFPKSQQREPWLQKNVFMPLLHLLTNGTEYRPHGNNIRLHHHHNTTYSTPDGTLTHKHQITASPLTAGPLMELEISLEEKNDHDKQNHFTNGQGQVVKYMIVEALAETEHSYGLGRKRFRGLLTDGRFVYFYYLDGRTLTFHRSTRFALLSDADEPTEGFQLLVRLFHAPPAFLEVPVPTAPIEQISGFKSFPHVVRLPIQPKSTKLIEIELTGLLGLGASSCAMECRYNNQKACIKVGAKMAASRQLQQEISVLPELQGVPGVPTMLFSRAVLKSSYPLYTCIVVQEVGLLTTSIPWSPEQLSVLYATMKVTLQAVHQRGFVHRDVTPTNIIVCDDNPILIDWGLAATLEDAKQPDVFQGTLNFSSVSYDTGDSSKSCVYSPSDDLEALVYTICALHHDLPWTICTNRNSIIATKQRSRAATICGCLSFLLGDLKALRDRKSTA
jgi:hypothetical protein